VTAQLTYVFDNENHYAVDQHRCLADMLDGLTIEQLAGTGVGPGWRCLEVGAGGGSIAEWLAREVAPGGEVVATDIKPVHLRPAPNLTVLRHDIVHETAPPGGFDLIHARLVLIHLPDRLAVLDKLVGALRPGGWLQLDEFDLSYGPLLLSDPADRELYEDFLEAKVRLMEAAGVDVAWGQHLVEAFTRVGLVDIDARAHLQQWDSAAPGVGLLVHHTRHLRDKFEAVGFGEDRLERVRALLADPRFRATSCPIYTVRGRLHRRDSLR
jgi:SAM-dependent methyltransferase